MADFERVCAFVDRPCNDDCMAYECVGGEDVCMRLESEISVRFTNYLRVDKAKPNCRASKTMSGRKNNG